MPLLLLMLLMEVLLLLLLLQFRGPGAQKRCAGAFGVVFVVAGVVDVWRSL